MVDLYCRSIIVCNDFKSVDKETFRRAMYMKVLVDMAGITVSATTEVQTNANILGLCDNQKNIISISMSIRMCISAHNVETTTVAIRGSILYKCIWGPYISIYQYGTLCKCN